MFAWSDNGMHFKATGIWPCYSLVLQQPLSTLTDPSHTAYNSLTIGYSFWKCRQLWLSFNRSGFKNLLNIFPGPSLILIRNFNLNVSPLSKTSQNTSLLLFPFQIHLQKSTFLRIACFYSLHICYYRLLTRKRAPAYHSGFLVPYSCFI